MPALSPRLAVIALISLTLLSYRLHDDLHGAVLATCALLLSFCKGQLIVDDFIGLRRVRGPWRLLFSAYLGVLTTTLILISQKTGVQP